MTHTTNVPTAQVVRQQGNYVTVLCPFCHRAHVHQLAQDARPGDLNRFAPACGFQRTPDQRATGYRFRVTPRKEN